MKKSFAIVALAGAAAFAGAQGFSYSGDTAAAPDGSWDRPIGGAGPISGLGPVNYDVESFIATVTGTFDLFSVQQYDGYLHVYEGSFDPLDQLANLIAGNDDGAGGIGTSDILGLSLTAGTEYFIVTSGFQAGDAGAFTNTLVPAPGAAALLGMGGLFAARRRRA